LRKISIFVPQFIFNQRMTVLKINDLSSIRDVARQFIELMDDKTVFAFNGSMGAGKTTFIKAICEELGVEDVINSPTFAIINEYHSEKLNDVIYHFDCYRIENPKEALEIGALEYLDSGSYCFIEWAEQIHELLPPNTVFVFIEEKENGSREISFL